MKKIAIMGGNLNEVNGAIKVTVNLTNELSRFFDVCLVTPLNTKSFFYLKSNIKRFNYRKPNHKLRYTLIFDCLRLHLFLKKNDIDILYIVDIGALPLVGFLAAIGIKNIKIIYAEHLTASRYIFVKQGMLRWISQKMINKYSDRIIVLTSKEKENYINKYNIKEEKIDFIYNYLDDNLLNDNVIYMGSNKKIITVGRVDYQKGYEYLIEVANHVMQRHKDWEWHIYGEVPRNGDKKYKNKLERKIKEYGLEEKVVFKKNNSNMLKLYEDYDIYVSTSRYEGLPLTLLEAKCKKIPLISFDINSGPSDIIRDGIDGFLIKPFEIETMVEKLDLLIENDDIRKKMSMNSYGNIDKFRKEKIIKQWIDLFNDIE